MTRGSLAFGVVIVAALLAAAHVARPPDAQPARPARAPARLTAPVVIGDQTAAPHRERKRPTRPGDEPHRVTRPAPEPARRVAADFIRSYLAYEVGRATFKDLRALRRTATARLWSELNSGRGEPRAPRSVATARLARLVSGVSARRRAATLLATLNRGTAETPLALVLRREHGQWRVAGVGR
jgi:hypothetical protein